MDEDGNAYIVGVTDSTDFPTEVRFNRTYGGGVGDGFVSKLDPNGSTLIYSTYLGGSVEDSGMSVAVDATGQVFVTGSTASTDFPTANPLAAEQWLALDDVFVAKLNASGSALVYSTYLGGSESDNDGYDEGFVAITIDDAGDRTWQGRVF